MEDLFWERDQLDVVDAVGTLIHRQPVVSNQLVVVDQLNQGVYQARVFYQAGSNIIVVSNAGFVSVGGK